MRCCLLALLLTVFKVHSQAPSLKLYPILWKWVKGSADSIYYFDNNHTPSLINNIKNAYQVKRATEFWYAKNLDSFNNGRQHWVGMTNFLGRFQGPAGLYRSGFNMTQQSLGTYTVHIQPKGKDSIQFTVVDIKSRWSALLHCPLVKNRLYDANRKRQKIMTNVKWVFTWTQAIQPSLFYNRTLNLLLYPHRKYSGKGY